MYLRTNIVKCPKRIGNSLNVCPWSSHLYLAIEKKLAAVICIENPLRKEAELVVRTLKSAGIKKVVMIGDGINASPALSAADVGIAISKERK